MSACEGSTHHYITKAHNVAIWNKIIWVAGLIIIIPGNLARIKKASYIIRLLGSSFDMCVLYCTKGVYVWPFLAIGNCS